MAFIANNVQMNKQEEPLKAPLSTDTSTTPQTGVALTKEETETLLLTIREMSFKGEHIERVYNLVYKLQQYYTSLNR
jgi:hypothetical protein